MTDLIIENNRDSSRFEVMLNEKPAWLDYRVELGTIFLLHVEVPPEEEGRGIASSLAMTALEFARDQDLKVVPLCPFIAAYMHKHPDLVVK